jgi:hypothetical protein
MNIIIWKTIRYGFRAILLTLILAGFGVGIIGIMLGATIGTSLMVGLDKTIDDTINPKYKIDPMTGRFIPKDY